MDAKEQILMNLPEKFTRADFVDVVGRETAYSLSHAQNLLDSSIHEQMIRRVSRGVYEKIEPEMELEQA